MSRAPVLRHDLSRLLEACQAALAQSPSEGAMREVVVRAVSEPAALMQALGEPARGGIQTLHRSPTLTVLNVIWAPGMSVMPHDHRMWAVIGSEWDPATLLEQPFDVAKALRSFDDANATLEK